jgi:hypothetical protein
VPFIEVVVRRELRWFGHIIRMDKNRKLRDLRDEELRKCGKKMVEDRMGRERVRIEWEVEG